jgi:hypothetical protein
MRPNGLAVAEANDDSACSRPVSVINERLRDGTTPKGRRLYCRTHRFGREVSTVKNAIGCHHGVRQAHIERGTHRHREDVDYSQQNVSWVEHPRGSAKVLMASSSSGRPCEPKITRTVSRCFRRICPMLEVCHQIRSRRAQESVRNHQEHHKVSDGQISALSHPGGMALADWLSSSFGRDRAESMEASPGQRKNYRTARWTNA